MDKPMEPLTERVNLNKMLKDLELEYIARAMVTTNGNIKAAAAMLGLNRTTLQMRLRGSPFKVKKEEPKLTEFIAPMEEDPWGPDPFAKERDSMYTGK